MDNKKIFQDPLISDNPITRQVLGICSALAVTVNLQQATVMSIAVTFVLCSSNVIVSMLRRFIPSNIRIIVQRNHKITWPIFENSTNALIFSASLFIILTFLIIFW